MLVVAGEEDEEAGGAEGGQQQGVRRKVQQEQGTIKDCLVAGAGPHVLPDVGVVMEQGGGDGLLSAEETRLAKERHKQRLPIS